MQVVLVTQVVLVVRVVTVVRVVRVVLVVLVVVMVLIVRPVSIVLIVTTVLTVTTDRVVRVVRVGRVVTVVGIRPVVSVVRAALSSRVAAQFQGTTCGRIGQSPNPSSHKDLRIGTRFASAARAARVPHNWARPAGESGIFGIPL